MENWQFYKLAIVEKCFHYWGEVLNKRGMVAFPVALEVVKMSWSSLDFGRPMQPELNEKMCFIESELHWLYHKVALREKVPIIAASGLLRTTLLSILLIQGNANTVGALYTMDQYSQFHLFAV